MIASVPCCLSPYSSKILCPKGLETSGLYRKSGNGAAIQKLRNQVNHSKLCNTLKQQIARFVSLILMLFILKPSTSSTLTIGTFMNSPTV